MVIRCDALNLLWAHTPKTGGSTMTAILRPWARSRLGKPKPPDVHGWQMHWHVGHMHTTYGEFRRHAESLDGYRWVAGVRNPWDRAVSQWWLQSQAGVVPREITFTEFAARLAIAARSGSWSGPLRWTRPCSDWVGPEPFRVIRYESLEADIRRLLLDLSAPVVAVPHHNRQPADRPSTESVLTPESIATIGEVYAQDVERFGYSPP